MPLEQLTTPSAGLFPEFEHFEVFAGQRPDEPYRCGTECYPYARTSVGMLPGMLLPGISVATAPLAPSPPLPCLAAPRPSLCTCPSPCSSLLTAFEQEALLDSSYFFCKQDSVVAAAQLLGQVRGLVGGGADCGAPGRGGVLLCVAGRGRAPPAAGRAPHPCMQGSQRAELLAHSF